MIKINETIVNLNNIHKENVQDNGDSDEIKESLENNTQFCIHFRKKS